MADPNEGRSSEKLPHFQGVPSTRPASDAEVIVRGMVPSQDQPSADLLGALVESLTEVSSAGYCGQTHIHKAAFIGQELLGVPFGLHWQLHHYGPFSRGVRPGLNRCEEEGTVATHVHPRGLRVMRPVDAPHIPLSIEFQEKLQLLARRLAPMTRDQLEKVATAAWVTRFPDGRDMTVQSRAAQVHKIKPHISTAVAAKAVVYLDDLVERARLELSSAQCPDPTLMRKLATSTSELYPLGGSLEVYRPRLRARIVIEELPRDS